MLNKDKGIYFENLDALRAVAAFFVVFFHISHWFDYPKTKFYDSFRYLISFGGQGGVLGVTFFFILSGFLITYLMLVEQSKNGSLNVPFFYYRRMIRIWPLYYLTLIVGFLIYPLISFLNGYKYSENSSVLLYSLFMVNFDNLFNGSPSIGILGVQWSVAIEEQFYLLWPIFFVFFNRRNIFPFLLVFVIVLSELFYLKAPSSDIGYYHLISNFRFLAFGALIAYLSYFKRSWINFFLNNINPNINFFIYLICILILFFNQRLVESFFYFKYINQIIPFLFFGFIIVDQNFSNKSFFKIGRSNILSWLGKISYGLYMTHMIAIYIVISLSSYMDQLHVGWKIIFSVILTIVISYLSFHYIETYFLSLKNKYETINKTLNLNLTKRKRNNN